MRDLRRALHTEADRRRLLLGSLQTEGLSAEARGMTDRLTLTRAFEGAGIQSEAAERIASEIYDAIHNNVATKQDLRELQLQLEAKIDRMVTRLGALVVIVATLLFAALHYWPPH
jgi:hypothetical protein